VSGPGYWQSNRYQKAGLAGNGSFTTVVDVGGVINPAPAAVYQSYQFANSGIGNTIGWDIPVADGDYVVRLHFAEPAFTASGQRLFDVQLQGVTVDASLDVFAAAGAQRKAVVREYGVSVSGGQGIALDLRNVISTAFVSGIEILRANPAGVTAPTVNLELSTDNGASWIPITGTATARSSGPRARRRLGIQR